MGGTGKVPLMRSKRCSDCGEIKPATEFWKNKSSKDGLAYYCKPCFRLRNSRSYRKGQAKLGKVPRPYRSLSDVPEGMKYCPSCRETKPTDAFGSNRAEKSGRAAYCRPCHNKAMAEIRARNLRQSEIVILSWSAESGSLVEPAGAGLVASSPQMPAQVVFQAVPVVGE